MADRASSSQFGRRVDVNRGGGAKNRPPTRPGEFTRKRSRSPMRGPHADSRQIKGNDRRSGHFLSRYDVVTPKSILTNKEVSVQELKRRFNKMYVPSDFFHADLLWSECFPSHEPYTLGNLCDFHVFHKDVEYPPSMEVLDDPTLLEPTDADYLYSAKVMLLSSKDLSSLYRSTIRVADEDVSSLSDKHSWMKELQFLVGTKNKSEILAIGGPWSPSLDGLSPDKDPQVLVNTAIRTCRSQTGIDLSGCVRWFKFLELHYYRPAERVHPSKTTKREGEEINAQDDSAKPVDATQTEGRVETVVIFLPDVYNCMPTPSEWQEQCNLYKSLLDRKIKPSEPVVEELQNGTNEEHDKSVKIDGDSQQGEETISADQSEKAAAKPEPTHFSKINLVEMKVAQLRTELEARGIENKGLKSQLVNKLEKVLKEEEEKEKKTSSEVILAATEDASTAQEAKAAATNEISEKDVRRLERLYRMEGTKPAIIVHPSRKSRNGRFDCEKVPLSTLLEYKVDDQREHTFEVSLFAEQFRDMVMRDSAFNLYRALLAHPETPDNRDDTDSLKTDTEPSIKRIKQDSECDNKENSVEATKIRKVKRTVDSRLLFGCTVFDTSSAGYLKHTDAEKILLSLGLNLSRSQMRKLFQKVDNRKEIVNYRLLTDKDVTEGDNDDVITLLTASSNKTNLPEIALGNRLFFEEPSTKGPKNFICEGTDSDLLEQYYQHEESRQSVEFQFGNIQNETERSKKALTSTQDARVRVEKEVKKLEEDLEEHRARIDELEHQNELYFDLLQTAKDLSKNVSVLVGDQFNAEKAKKEAEDQAKLLLVQKAEENETEEKMEDKPDFKVLDSA